MKRIRRRPATRAQSGALRAALINLQRLAPERAKEWEAAILAAGGFEGLEQWTASNFLQGAADIAREARRAQQTENPR